MMASATISFGIKRITLLMIAVICAIPSSDAAA
jgi:hypothetical protein